MLFGSVVSHLSKPPPTLHLLPGPHVMDVLSQRVTQGEELVRDNHLVGVWQ